MSIIFIIAALLSAAAPALAQTGSEAVGGAAAQPVSDAFALVAGRILSMAEAALFEGGDVFIDLDANRSKLTVRRTLNERDDFVGRLMPVEVYEIDAHNRVVQKAACADYMPTAGGLSRIGGSADQWKSTPVPFPSGMSRITAVAPCSDKFGPFMIKTDAVGTVDVYMPDGRYYGKEHDTGYAIHSNTNDFAASRSWGCVIVRQKDNERLAKTLIADRKQDPKSKQRIWVP